MEVPQATFPQRRGVVPEQKEGAAAARLFSGKGGAVPKTIDDGTPS